MSGVYIKDMQIPDSCHHCDIGKRVIGVDRYKCLFTGKDFNSWEAGWSDDMYRHPSCPMYEMNDDETLILDEKIGKLLEAICKAQEALRIARRI